MKRSNIHGLILALGSLLMVSVPDRSFSQFSLQPLNLTVQQVTDICNAGDERLFIAQQNGLIRICDLDGILTPLPFLDISSKVISGGERGLLGVVFSPEFLSDGYFYVNYTGLDGDNRISRFSVGNDPDIADPASEEILFIIDQPYSNHNGGGMKFGPDGFLYIGSGDGGAAGDPQNNGQDPYSLLGKILRLDVGVRSGYLVPSDNPFFNGISGDPLVWSMGLRNPWRISFDSQNGDLWIGDVGQNKWEEIDREKVIGTTGKNYGWKCYEANAVYDTTGCEPASSYTPPYFAYDHTGGNCSVTGGFVYRGALHESWYGRYFFTDYCTGEIRSLADSNSQVTEITHGNFSPYSYSTFGEDVYGELYVGKTGSGVFRLTDTTECSPVAHISDADSLEFCGPDFSLSTPYHPQLNYIWYRNDTVVSQSSGSIYTGEIGGHYRVEVVNNSGCSSVSSDVFVQFTKAPRVSIDLPSPFFCKNSTPLPVPVTPDGGVFSGAGMNTGIFVPQAAGAGAHVITYRYTSAVGCTQEVRSTFRVDSCTAGFLDNGNWFSILQNPVQNNLVLSIQRPVRENTDLLIYDVAGRLVFSEMLPELGGGDVLEIDISGLSDGVFLITSGAGSVSQAQKFQKVSY